MAALVAYARREFFHPDCGRHVLEYSAFGLPLLKFTRPGFSRPVVIDCGTVEKARELWGLECRNLLGCELEWIGDVIETE